MSSILYSLGSARAIAIGFLMLQGPGFRHSFPTTLTRYMSNVIVREGLIMPSHRVLVFRGVFQGVFNFIYFSSVRFGTSTYMRQRTRSNASLSDYRSGVVTT